MWGRCCDFGGNLCPSTPSWGEFIRGGGDDEVERLYERVAIGRPTHECHVSAEAFQVLADLAVLAPREIVRRLPSPRVESSGCACANIGLHDRTISACMRVSHTLPTQGMRHFAARPAISLMRKRPQES